MTQFDYVIVGAGSAGCVLANRLSENPSNRVLLLEAGEPDNHPAFRIPMGFGLVMYNPRYDWQFPVKYNEYAASRDLVWSRGKTLGGSSSINGMVVIRGQPQDYDTWRQLGNPGWGWDDVLPYFKKLENYEPGESEHHGIGGPINVSTDPSRLPICDAVIAAGEEAGIRRKFDVNDGDQEGIGYFHLSTRNGIRSSTANAYLKPVRKRTNLKVLTSALAARVLLEGNKAVGIEYEHDGQMAKAFAAKETILSGGVINSPQLLQLSGIGPGDVLKPAGIEVKVSLPGVGKNLQDHAAPQIAFRTSETPTLNSLTRGAGAVGEFAKWLFNRSGVLSKGPAHVQVFLRSRKELETPDLQIHVNPMSTDLKKYEEEQVVALEKHHGVTFIPCQLRPESRGWLRISSPSFKASPDIVANYLDTDLDQATCVEGVKWSRRIAEQPAVRDYIKMELNPGPDCQSDEQLLDFCRDNVVSVAHPVGTCRMGPAEDTMAVVDPQLCVHKVENLRVVDASIMPRLVSGNTNIPTIMVAEKAADMILQTN